MKPVRTPSPAKRRALRGPIAIRQAGEPQASTTDRRLLSHNPNTDWLHNGDVCRLLNISKRTLQHYRDTGVLPFTQIGHKCYYRREDVERLLQTKSEKSKNNK